MRAFFLAGSVDLNVFGRRASHASRIAYFISVVEPTQMAARAKTIRSLVLIRIMIRTVEGRP